VTLTPIRRVGSTSPQTYAQGDFIGTETSPTGLTDHRGFNEVADWTVRAYETLLIEHYDNGVHNSLRVPRALIIGNWDGALYTTTFQCYAQSTAGVVTIGTTAATLARPVAGEITVTLAHALPSSAYRIKDISVSTANAGPRVHVYLVSITSTTVFRLRRWEGDPFDSMVATDGDFAVAVYDA
jgi:hypothetical protein